MKVLVIHVISPNDPHTIISYSILQELLKPLWSSYFSNTYSLEMQELLKDVSRFCVSQMPLHSFIFV